MTSDQFSDLLRQARLANPTAPPSIDAVADYLLRERNRLSIALQAAGGQRDRARAIAEALAPALRRCVDDSKDLAAGRTYDPPWVDQNIRMAEAALDLWEDKDW